MAEQRQLLDPGTARPKRRPPRREGDAYYTIVEATAALIQEFPEIAGELLFDPTCGDGRMARQLMQAQRFRSCHINDVNGPDALTVPGCTLASAHDACHPDLWIARPRPDAVVTNPPWESAGTIAWAALRVAPIVALLLRCTSPTWASSGCRWAMAAEWTLATGCEGWVLPLEATGGNQHRVLVHRHPVAPEIWCLTCFAAGYDLAELDAKDGAAARAEALQLLERVLSRRLLLVRRAKGATAPALPPAARPKVRPARARLTKRTIVFETRKDA